MKNSRIIFPAVVRNTNDPNGKRRIQAEIKELNDGGLLAELPWADPMLNTELMPKEGEAVLIFLQDPSSPYSNRLWLSRTVSGFDNFGFDSYDTAMRGTLHSDKEAPKQSGAYPKAPTDVYLLGRDGTEMSFGKDEYDLSIGKRESANPTKVNSRNGRHRMRLLKKLGYTMALQADTIMLASYRSQPKPNPNMSDEDLEALFSELEGIAKGETLVRILKLLRDAIQTHIHKYHLLPADRETPSMVRLGEANLDSIVNPNIKTN